MRFPDKSASDNEMQLYSNMGAITGMCASACVCMCTCVLHLPEAHLAGHLLVLLHQCLVLLVEVENLSNTLGSQLGLLGAGEGVVVAGHIGHDGTLIGLDGAVDVW